MCPYSYNRTSRRSKNDVPSLEEAVVAPSAREPEGARALEQEEQEPRSGTRERQRVKQTPNKRRAALGAQCSGLGASATGSKQHLLEPSRQCRADRGNQKTVTLRVVVASIPFPGAPVYEEMDQATLFLNCTERWPDFSNVTTTTPVPPQTKPLFGIGVDNFITLVVFGIIFTLGVLGNSLVITVLARSKPGKPRSTTNIFILNLSIADLAYLLFCIPFQATVYILPTWVLGAFICKFIHLFFTLSMLVSIFTLSAMSVDRYVAIVHSRRSSSIRVSRNALLGVGLIWALSVAMTVPVAYNQRLIHREGNQTFCWEQWDNPRHKKVYVVCTFVFGYLLPLLLISFCYAKATGSALAHGSGSALAQLWLSSGSRLWLSSGSRLWLSSGSRLWLSSGLALAQLWLTALAQLWLTALAQLWLTALAQLLLSSGSTLAHGSGSALARLWLTDLAQLWLSSGSRLWLSSGSALAHGSGSALAHGSGSALAHGSGSTLAHGSGSALAPGSGSALAQLWLTALAQLWLTDLAQLSQLICWLAHL
ncbi:hypothetical protein NDU88_005576 [Pleurodeles waltl]|uniref:G-protein coupled receptors family 1 profile domain-containing protein n=1 Tax=Pleurodeles waltl TaxID=8319 RepID=A0AAV7VJD7_PLEWA|nr:hypothetical protein NDU88_005576 [Pleurodeles waltl]